MTQVLYAQEESSDVTPMEKQELQALYSTIQGFVGDSWNGSSLYPDPCGWSPIQVHFFQPISTIMLCQKSDFETFQV